MFEEYINFVFDIGLIGFFCYMVVVGTFIPAPTQVLLIPAGMLVQSGEMSIIPLLLTTAAGTTVGASINYSISKKYTHKIIPKKRVNRIKKVFKKYGVYSVLFAPLMLGMGQYISLVAGMSRMSLSLFIPAVFLANFIFDGIMVSIGYFAGDGSYYPLLFVISGITFVVLFFYFKIKNDEDLVKI